MQRKLKVLLAISSILSVTSAIALTHSKRATQLTQSPYSDQLTSPIRGLSAQEVDNLLNGRGAGYARTAELNSYPGPLHIIELQDQIEVSNEQLQQIEFVFQEMKAEAKALGEDIVEREQELSTAFASHQINPSELQTQTQRLAELYGKLRATHLEAHLAVTPLLSPEQIAAYNNLRGYTGEKATHEHHHKHQ